MSAEGKELEKLENEIYIGARCPECLRLEQYCQCIKANP